MQVKAKDQLHVSSVKADTIHPGEVFEVSDAEGKQLLDSGLVTKVAAPAAPKKAPAKKSPAPKNKMKPIAANKAR